MVGGSPWGITFGSKTRGGTNICRREQSRFYGTFAVFDHAVFNTLRIYNSSALSLPIFIAQFVSFYIPYEHLKFLAKKVSIEKAKNHRQSSENDPIEW